MAAAVASEESEPDTKSTITVNKKTLAWIVAVLLLVLACNFGLTLCAIELLKEHHVDGADLVNRDGKRVRTDTFEAKFTPWDVPQRMSAEHLSYLKNIDLFIKMDDTVVHASFKVSGGYKPWDFAAAAASTTEAVLVTDTGFLISIDAANRVATIQMGDGTYDASFGREADAGRRRLDVDDAYDEAARVYWLRTKRRLYSGWVPPFANVVGTTHRGGIAGSF